MTLIQQAHQPCFSPLQVAGNDRPTPTLGQLQQLGNDLDAAASRSLSSNVPGKLQLGLQAQALEHACAQLTRSGQPIAPPELGAASPVLVNRLVACGLVLKTTAAAEHQPARQALLNAMEGLHRSGDGFYHGRSSAMPRAVERVEAALMAYVRAVGVDTVGNQIMQDQVLPATLLRISQNFPELVEHDAQGQPREGGRLMLGADTPASLMQTQRCQGVREAFNQHVAANNPVDLCNALLELTKLPEFVLDGAKARALQPPAPPAAGPVPVDLPLALGPLGAGQVQQANPVITANPYNYNNVNLPENAGGTSGDVAGMLQVLGDTLKHVADANERTVKHLADSNERTATLLDNSNERLAMLLGKTLDMNAQLRGIGNVDVTAVDHNTDATDRGGVDSGVSNGRRRVASHGTAPQPDGRTAGWVDDARLRLPGSDHDDARSDSVTASSGYDTVATGQSSVYGTGSSADWPVGIADDNPALASYLLDARRALRPVDARGTHEMLASDDGDRVAQAAGRRAQPTASLLPGTGAAPNGLGIAAHDRDLLRLPGLAGREGSFERQDWQQATQRVLRPTAEQRLSNLQRDVLSDAIVRERLGTPALDQREALRSLAGRFAAGYAAPGVDDATAAAENLQRHPQGAGGASQPAAQLVVTRAAGERAAVNVVLPSTGGDLQRVGGIVPLPGLVAADAHAQLHQAIARLQSTPAASSMHTQPIVPTASFAALLTPPQGLPEPAALPETAALRSHAATPPLSAPALVRAQQQLHDAQPASLAMAPPPPPPMPVVAAAPPAATGNRAQPVRELDVDRRAAMMEQIRNFAFPRPVA